MTKVSMRAKREVSEGAAEALVRGILPISFTYRKPGITRFAKALISFGQTLHPTAIVNDALVNNILPAPQTVRASITSRASYTRKKIKDSMETLMKRGGGITCDGLKQRVNGKKYYDFVLHFVEYTENDISCADNASVHTLVLFIFSNAGAEN